MHKNQQTTVNFVYVVLWNLRQVKKVYNCVEMLTLTAY